jgi:excisionase family DNA binding protein
MIVEGVLVPAPLAARYGAVLAALVRAQCRRDGSPVPVDLAALLDELVEVGDAYRNRGAGSDDGTSGTDLCGTGDTLAEWDTKWVASRLGVSDSFVRRLARAGALPGRRMRGTWLFDPLDVDEYLTARSA